MTTSLKRGLWPPRPTALAMAVIAPLRLEKGPCHSEQNMMERDCLSVGSFVPLSSLSLIPEASSGRVQIVHTLASLLSLSYG